MKSNAIVVFLAAAFSVASATVAQSAPTAVDLLFNARHVDNLNAGQELTYTFTRDVKNSTSFGKSFEDSILIEATHETPEKAKNLKLKVFSGDRARDNFETPGMTGNPLLIWYLNRCVSSYNQVAGGSTMYLKGKIRNALGDEAKVEETDIATDGKTVKGYRISVVPFANDPAKSRMNGYENSKLEIVLSDQIPGHFYTMSAQYMSNGKGTPVITETISYKGVGEPK